MMANAVLHFSRVRRQGEALYFDPQTDIRLILPNVMQAAMERLLDEYADKPEEKALLHLSTCVRILQIRLEEDSLPMDAQLGEFMKAIEEVPAEIVNLWMGTVVRAMICAYALFMRRDAQSDSAALAAMLESTKLSLYRVSLQPGTYQKVREELGSSVPLLVQNKTRDGVVVCHETGEVMERVKDIARLCMGCTGDRSWNALADACDEQFNAGKHTGKEQMALALAFPTYSHPCLTVSEKTEYGSENETGQAADQR